MTRTPQIHLMIKQTMDKYGIKGKDLAALVGVGAVHISEVRAGRRWVSPEVFAALLEGMDELAPGSRQYFCQLLAGRELTGEAVTIGDKIAELVAIANDDDIEKTLQAVASRWKQGYKVDTSNSTNILENEEPEKIPDKIGV